MTTHMKAPSGTGHLVLCGNPNASSYVLTDWDLVNCPRCRGLRDPSADSLAESKPPVVHKKAPSGVGSLCSPLLREEGALGELDRRTEDPTEVTCPNCKILLAWSANRASPPSQNRQIGGDHYTSLDIQPWDAMKAWHPDRFISYLHLSAIKYLARAGGKGSYLEDIKKAHHYLERLLEELEARA